MEFNVNIEITTKYIAKTTIEGDTLLQAIDNIDFDNVELDRKFSNYKITTIEDKYGNGTVVNISR